LYRLFKLKLESMSFNIVRQSINESTFAKPVARFGINKNYEFLDIRDQSVKDYIQHHLFNYKIDWSE
jgi:hypothetical protein